MTAPILTPGDVLRWEGFRKSDGEKAPKLFIIVGAHADKNYLGIRATKVQRARTFQPEDGADYYFIPGGQLEFFDLDTWVLFTEAQEFNRAGVEREFSKDEMQCIGSLRFQVANEICNKMKRCEDVSERHKNLLGPALTGPKPA